MNSLLIIGIGYIILAVFGLLLFLFNVRMFKKFTTLKIIGKTVLCLIIMVSVAMMMIGSYKGFKHLSYKEYSPTETTLMLEKIIDNMSFRKKEFNQPYTEDVYKTGEISKLLDNYTEKGQADIQAISGGSGNTKELILRNVGRVLTDKKITPVLSKLDGTDYQLLNNKNKLIVFADDSVFSIERLTDLHTYSRTNDLDYIIVFPTMTGTQVTQFFNENESNIGGYLSKNVVSYDSMRMKEGFDLLFLTQSEYIIKSLPSYIAIDSNNIISNAGVGGVFTDQISCQDFINRSFIENNKLYYEIKQ